MMMLFCLWIVNKLQPTKSENPTRWLTWSEVAQMSTITNIQGDCGGDSLRGTQGSLAIAKPKASPRQREYADIEGVPYRPKRTWSMRT